MNNFFISVCIPNYKRPKELERLLSTVDSKLFDEVEIVICDDRSPNAAEIRAVVDNFKANTKYQVVYIENLENYGYDRNLRELVKHSSGKWLVYMGNDDEFVPGVLDQLINFIRQHDELGYVMKSHRYIHKNGKTELFRYYDGNTFFPAGLDAYLNLFRKSVFISGFTIKRSLTRDLLVDRFDGTLLFQLYLLAEVCLKYPSAYFDTPLTQQHDEGTPDFGSSKNEQGITPGQITVENSLKFLKGYFVITEFIDQKYQLKSTKRINLDMSKYFYPSLAIQRNKGVITFIKYVRELNKIGFNASLYYYVYVVGLVIFGKRNCDNLIRIIKNILGKTPKL